MYFPHYVNKLSSLVSYNYADVLIDFKDEMLNN